MSESLGDALLSLGTKDNGFTEGVTRAEGRAKQLGGLLDKTSGSATRLGNELSQTGKQAEQFAIAEAKADMATKSLAAAQASAATTTARLKEQLKAGEINQRTYNAEVLKTKAALDLVQNEYRQSIQSLNNLKAAQASATVQTGAQRAGMQQLGAQIGDIATMYSLGARPTQIFASQIGQVTQAIQLASGGTSRFAAFLGGPWGVAISAGAVVLAPFVAKLFETESALEAVELSTDKLGEAQDILSSVIDRQTGKLKDNANALMVMARAQAIAGRVGAMGRQAEARSALGGIAAGDLNLVRSPGRLFNRGELARDQSPASFIAQRYLGGELDPEVAIRALEKLEKQGKITQQQLIDTSGQIANLFLETSNIETFETLGRALNGDQSAIGDIMGPGKERKDRRGRKRSGPDQDEIDARFNGQMVGITQQILSARMQVARSAEERAELEARSVEWDRRQSIADIRADENMSKAQKAELEAAVTRLADAQLEAIEFGKRIELEREAQALADTYYNVRREALQLQYSLADTDAARKDIALKMLAAEEEHLRVTLQRVINAKETSDRERLAAQIALEALYANSEAKRETVRRSNETTVDRFMRDLNKTPAQLNEAIDQIRVDGLEAFNDELVDAIVNFRSLGDVAKSVFNQILADILRLAIRQALIKPLASFLGLGGGAAPLASLIPSVNSTINNPANAGFFANGGLIPRGKFGIVGERGPEAVFATAGGVEVLPNSTLRAMQGGGVGEPSAVRVVIEDTTGLFVTRVEQLSTQVVAAAAPAIVSAGGRAGAAQMQKMQSRRLG